MTRRDGRSRLRLLGWTRTIRGRLLAGFLLALVVGLAGSTVATSVLLRDYLNSRDRATLDRATARMQLALGSGPRTVEEEDVRDMLGYPLGGVVIDRSGRASLRYSMSDAVATAVTQMAKRRPYGRTFEFDDAEIDVSLLARRLPAPDLRIRAGGRVTDASAVVLTVDSKVSATTVRRFVVRQIGVLLVSLVVLGASSLLVLRTGLRPLRQMAADADAIAAGTRVPGLPAHGGGTETDRLAAALNRAFEARAAAEERIRSFAADASHELRTPLATISGWLELYNQGGLDDSASLDRALDRVNAEVSRMRLLVEDLSLLARLDAGRPLERGDVDLVALADSIAQDARVVDRELNLTVRAETPVHVLGDDDRLAQVLRNLVGNAVQHTPPGTSVAIDISRQGNSALVEVSDEGPGISPALLPHLFERFWRADSSRSRHRGGSGLGLAIVYAIIRAHDGTITVRSRVSEGTTISFTLPGADASSVREGGKG